MLKESISVYNIDAGRCSEACPAHVALSAGCVYTSRQSSTTEPLGFILFYRVAPSFLAFRKQASFFPNDAAKAEQKLAI